MIEDKKLGVKIAISPLEALWTRIRDASTMSIQNAKDSLIIEEAILQLAETKLKEIVKK